MLVEELGTVVYSKLLITVFVGGIANPIWPRRLAGFPKSLASKWHIQTRSFGSRVNFRVKFRVLTQSSLPLVVEVSANFSCSSQNLAVTYFLKVFLESQWPCQFGYIYIPYLILVTTSSVSGCLWTSGISHFLCFLWSLPNSYWPGVWFYPPHKLMSSPVSFMDAGRTHVIPRLETKDLLTQHSKQHGISMLALVPLDTRWYDMQTL